MIDASELDAAIRQHEQRDRLFRATEAAVENDGLGAGIKIMASSQGQNGKVDSALFYFRLSDSLLVGDVAVPTFDSTDTGREVRVIVTNPREKPNAPYKLIFEFVDLQGQVVATDTVAVPPIQPGQSQQFELKPAGASIAAWRYRKEGA
ncbi:MAG TPA: hypothetical protein VGQ29_06295 [Gemmatimonadales bacterium]|nr:hypothetical protein [Gemmatimonadales bacterium]